MRGMPIPCWAKTYCTRPEQSNERGVVPPRTYGTPMYRRAVRTMSSPEMRARTGTSREALVEATRAVCAGSGDDMSSAAPRAPRVHRERAITSEDDRYQQRVTSGLSVVLACKCLM